MSIVYSYTVARDWESTKPFPYSKLALFKKASQTLKVPLHSFPSEYKEREINTCPWNSRGYKVTGLQSLSGSIFYTYTWLLWTSKFMTCNYLQPFDLQDIHLVPHLKAPIYHVLDFDGKGCSRLVKSIRPSWKVPIYYINKIFWFLIVRGITQKILILEKIVGLD